jgi:ribosome maturation factor RimP
MDQTELETLLAPTIEPMGYELVRVRLSGSPQATLQVMAERADGKPMAVEDCESISRALSAKLDVEDPIAAAYTLEVSSPGIDRPLVRARDFAAYLGHEAKIELSDMLDGRRRFRGIIKAVDDETVTVTLPEAPRDTDPDYKLPLRLLADAKLVMTDKLMNMAQVDQEEFPIDEDEDIETVELSDDPEAGTAEDAADHTNLLSDDPEAGPAEDADTTHTAEDSDSEEIH